MKETFNGLVIRSTGGLFEVMPDDPARENLLCRARGSLRREEGRVLVGDRVTVLCEEEGRRGETVIDCILPRRNSLIRPPLANLDCLYAVLAVTDPAPIPETTDKLLAIMEKEEIPAKVVITKCDLGADSAAALAEIYRKAGYEVFSVCSRTGEGLAALSADVTATLSGGHIAAFSGASGVGKSSLINALFPSLSLETGDISHKIGRGKNTTRHAALYPVFGDASGGFLADTPGFSMLDFLRFDFMTATDLPHVFREMAPYLNACRYGDCSHVKEEECAVRAAVEAGIIPRSRYESYTALYEVLKGKSLYGGSK